LLIVCSNSKQVLLNAGTEQVDCCLCLLLFIASQVDCCFVFMDGFTGVVAAPQRLSIESYYCCSGLHQMGSWQLPCKLIAVSCFFFPFVFISHKLIVVCFSPV